MKASELMPGDIVRYEYDGQKTPAKVVEIYRDSVLVEDISGEYEPIEIDEAKIYPIEITQEILEKNGFTKSERYEVWKIIRDDYELRITPWRIAVIFLDEDGADKEEFSAPRPKYVHQLQHALRLCGIEKEIKL